VNRSEASTKTLKALANFSPGFALKPWVTNASNGLVATLKELRPKDVNTPRNSFRVAKSLFANIPYPGLPKRNPGLKLANAFSVNRFFDIFPISLFAL
jgi:hypothetical protein